MSVIRGYKLLGELSAQNAGFCQWGFCERGGREYFIKEFLSPIYPADNSNLSERILERKRRLCEDFYANKKAFYDVLSCCRTGNNILVQDFFRSGTKYYIVTDKVDADGTDPAMISRLSREKKEAFIRSILYSISKLHRAKIVHADLKPDNILLKKTDGGYYTAKIVDFDAGFLIGKVPADIQGDFIYLAPEVYLKMNEEDVDLNEKIDIFALGILFHQYWTGELPRMGSDYKYAFEAVLDGSEVQLSDSIPLELRTFISRMLSKDPAARPGADEILARFRAKDVRTDSVTPKADTASEKPVSRVKMSPGFYVPKDLD